MGVRPEMGKPIIVKAGEIIVETGIAWGACVLAIALLGMAQCMATVGTPECFMVHHIAPGNIVDELTAMLKLAANGRVTVWGYNISGPVEQLAGTGLIFTSMQAIKRAFRWRDRQRPV